MRRRDTHALSREEVLKKWGWILTLTYCDISNSLATIILMSSVDGRQGAFPGEMVTYTCSVTTAATISWTAAPLLINPGFVQFSANSPPNQRMRDCSNFQSINCTLFNFQAALTNVGQLDMNGLANLTSTLSFTVTSGLNGIVVQCSALAAVGTEERNVTLIVTGM